MRNLNKRLQQAEKTSNPEPMPEVEIELLESRDQHFNRHMYKTVPDRENRHRLEPIPGYDPPADPVEVNNTVR